MTPKRPSTKPADRDERLRRYAELRDQGMTRAEAARHVGVAYDGAGTVYERWYLSDRGLPPPQQTRWSSA
jgi:transposase